MGLFSSFCSAVSSAVSRTASYVKEKASETLSWAREKASQALDWVAEKGEKFIDDVKETYQKVKPFLQKAQPWIDKIAATAIELQSAEKVITFIKIINILFCQFFKLFLPFTI